MRTLRQNIARLEDWYPNLFLEPHLVAAVALLSEHSESPAVFEVRRENISAAEDECRLELSWNPAVRVKGERLRATMQRKPLVELAATAVALVAARRFLDLDDVDVTEYGDRADFRSLSRSCVLEISGTEVAAELDRRHREKVAQALSNPYRWDAFVIVCLFSAKGHCIRISYHSSRKASDD